MSVHAEETLGRFFYRKRCEASLNPEEIRSLDRRRVTGLRIEELAERVGLSPDYLRKVEQDQKTPSTPALESLARALCLDATERVHVFNLANHRVPPLAVTQSQAIPPGFQRMLDAYDTIPAYILDGRWDTIAWNQSTCGVFCYDFATLPAWQRNLCYILFVSPVARNVIKDWSVHAKNVIGQLRADYGYYKDDPDFINLIEGMRDMSEEFATWWSEGPIVSSQAHLPKIIFHPIGQLDFEQTVCVLPETPGWRLVMYVPATDTTKKLLHKIAEKPPEHWLRQGNNQR